jgi:hypothetical protein
LLRPPLLHAIAEQFVKGNDVENGFYLGIPLLVLVIVGSVRMRRQPLVMSFASLGVFSFVICLGVHLTVANHVTRIPLPLAAITGVPVLQEVGPSRFALAIPLAASLLLTLVLDRVLQRPGLKGIRGPAALAGLSLLVLLPLLPSSPNPSAPVRIPDYFSSSAVTEIPNGSTVLAYPYPCASRNRAMLWQTASHMRFRIIGAGVYVPAPSRHSTDCPHGDLSMNVLSVLIERRPWHVPSASQRSGLVRNLQGYVDSHSVDAIVVRTSGAQGQWISALMASAFGGPTSIHGDVSVWLKPVTI